jgi:hypothetical protein
MSAGAWVEDGKNMCDDVIFFTRSTPMCTLSAFVVVFFPLSLGYYRVEVVEKSSPKCFFAAAEQRRRLFVNHCE